MNLAFLFFALFSFAPPAQAQQAASDPGYDIERIRQALIQKEGPQAKALPAEVSAVISPDATFEQNVEAIAAKLDSMGIDSRRVEVPIEFYFPATKLGSLGLSQDEDLTSIGAIGFSMGATPLQALKSESDPWALKALKSVIVAADFSLNRGTDKFTKFLRSYERTDNLRYTPEEWANAHACRTDSYGFSRCGDDSCDSGTVYSCGGGDTCCERTETVKVYGTEDGHEVAWQKGTIAVEVKTTIAELLDRVRLRGGIARTWHDLKLSNNSDGAQTTWKTSWDFTTDVAFRIAGNFELGASYKQSFAGQQNRGIRIMGRTDLRRLIEAMQ